MKLQATEWIQDPKTGAISYNIHVSADGIFIASVPVKLTANPTVLNIRAAQKAALRANMRVRIQELLEKQGNDLENG